MKLIAIAFHSGYGHTAKVAGIVAEGAASVEGTRVVSLPVDKVDEPIEEFANGWDLLQAADAIVFGAPTYMGGPSAQFKAFADASSKVWFGQGWKDKYAAGFTNSLTLSGDKSNTLISLFTLASQHSMVWISQGVPHEGLTLESVNRFGAWSGLMTQSDNLPPEQTPGAGDIETARRFGARIATFVVNH